MSRLRGAAAYTIAAKLYYFYIIQRIALKVNEKSQFRHFSENYMDKFEKGLDFLVILCYNIKAVWNKRVPA